MHVGTSSCEGCKDIYTVCVQKVVTLRHEVANAEVPTVQNICGTFIAKLEDVQRWKVYAM